MISAFIVITALGSSQPFVEKQIRVDLSACHLPAIKGEYPSDDEWHKVTIRIVCKR